MSLENTRLIDLFVEILKTVQKIQPRMREACVPLEQQICTFSIPMMHV